MAIKSWYYFIYQSSVSQFFLQTICTSTDVQINTQYTMVVIEILIIV